MKSPFNQIDALFAFLVMHHGAMVGQKICDEDNFGNIYVTYDTEPLKISVVIDRDQPQVLLSVPQNPEYEVSIVKLAKDLDPSSIIPESEFLGPHGLEMQARLLEKFFHQLPKLIDRRGRSMSNS